MPQDGQRDAKGTQREPTGTQREPKVTPKEAKGSPKIPKGSQREKHKINYIYIYTGVNASIYMLTVRGC